MTNPATIANTFCVLSSVLQLFWVGSSRSAAKKNIDANFKYQHALFDIFYHLHNYYGTMLDSVTCVHAYTIDLDKLMLFVEKIDSSGYNYGKLHIFINKITIDTTIFNCCFFYFNLYNITKKYIHEYMRIMGVTSQENN